MHIAKYTDSFPQSIEMSLNQRNCKLCTFLCTSLNPLAELPAILVFVFLKVLQRNGFTRY